MLPEYIYWNEIEFPSLDIWYIVLNDEYKASMITFSFCLRFAKCPNLLEVCTWMQIKFYIEVPLSNHAHWTFNWPLSYAPAMLDLVTNLDDAKVCSNADLALDIA